MKIAFTSKGTDWDAHIDPRFGRTSYFLIYDEKSGDLYHVDNRSVENEAHGAGPKTAKKLFDLGARVLITGNGPGNNAASVLEKASVDIYVGAEEMTVRQAYEAYKNKELILFNFDMD